MGRKELCFGNKFVQPNCHNKGQLRGGSHILYGGSHVGVVRFPL